MDSRYYLLILPYIVFATFVCVNYLESSYYRYGLRQKLDTEGQVVNGVASFLLWPLYVLFWVFRCLFRGLADIKCAVFPRKVKMPEAKVIK